MAIFGAILLFALGIFVELGMNFNQGQFLQMQVFRKALNYAYNNDETGVSWVTLEDKPLPTSGDLFGKSERRVRIMPANVYWTQDMYITPEHGKDKDLPRVHYEINGQRYDFTTAGWTEYACETNTTPIREKKDCKNCSPSWKWKTVSCGDVEVGKAYDVDADDKEELVVEKAGGGAWVMDSSSGEPVSVYIDTPITLYLMDNQEGDLDLTYSSADKEAGKKMSGLQADYDKTATERSSFNRQTSQGGTTTTTAVDMQETFAHKILLNKITQNVRDQVKSGDYLDENNKILYVGNTFTQRKTTRWFTPR